MNSVVPLFSTPVYIGDIDITSEERKHCAALPKSEGAFHKFFISHDDRILNDPALAELKKRATHHLENYATDVYKINQDSFNFYINTSWVSDMDNESAVEPHNHKYSIFTGVIVLDCTVATNLYLENHFNPIAPGFFRFMYDDYNTYNSPNWCFDMAPNKIYLFPSELGHSAKCFLPDGKLSVIAFDTFIKGYVGKHSTNLTFK